MKNNSRFVKLSTYGNVNYDAYNYSEYTYSTKYLPFGEKNDYMLYLRNLYIQSPTHQAIVHSVANLTTANGIIVINPEVNVLSNKYINDNFDTETIKNMVNDLYLYGFCVLKVFGDGDIVKYTEAINYRLDVPDDDNNINYCWYSNDWQNANLKRNRPTKLPLYKEGTDEEYSIMWISVDKKGYKYYAPVPYAGGNNYIEIESKIGEFHLNAIANSFAPSFMINYYGDSFSEEQMNSIEKALTDKFSGSQAAGRIIMNFSSSKDLGAELIKIEQSDLDSRFEQLSSECSKKIQIAHGLPSQLLAGINDGGQGFSSNSDELETAFYLWYEQRLKHLQNYILVAVRKLMSAQLLFAPIEFSTYNPFKRYSEATKLSKTDSTTELLNSNVSVILEKSKIKLDENYILLKEDIFDGNLKDGCYYKFVKSSRNETFLSKKLEIMTKNGYIFTKNDYNFIKNTADYYFVEQKYLKKS